MGGLTQTEQRSHFAFWCMLSAPLILGNDPRHMTKATLQILTAKEVIAISQDTLAKQARKVGGGGWEGGGGGWSGGGIGERSSGQAAEGGLRRRGRHVLSHVVHCGVVGSRGGPEEEGAACGGLHGPVQCGMLWCGCGMVWYYGAS